MMPASVLLIVLLFLALAWVNGANDVAKGVATLAGSGTCTARRALLWGSVWTALGGVAAVIWGHALLTTFSTGFLAPGFRLDKTVLFGIASGACAWVMLATRRGLPVSTTHALLGGIVGAVLATVGPAGLRATVIAQKALVPLLVSPLIAVVLCWLLLRAVRFIVARIPAWQPGCCAQEEWDRNPYRCPDPYRSTALDRLGRRLWPALHWLSGGATSFARGLNDVPKIAAPLIATMALLPGLQRSLPLGADMAVLLVVTAMALGSVWGGQRVLHVLAHRVARLDAGTGLTANVGTSLVVLLATPLGLPVSTTHVSTGALMGIRWAHRTLLEQRDALTMILFGWVVTLPVAAAVAAMSVWVVKSI